MTQCMEKAMFPLAQEQTGGHLQVLPTKTLQLRRSHSCCSWRFLYLWRQSADMRGISNPSPTLNHPYSEFVVQD